MLLQCKVVYTTYLRLCVTEEILPNVIVVFTSYCTLYIVAMVNSSQAFHQRHSLETLIKLVVPIPRVTTELQKFKLIALSPVCVMKKE